MLFLLNDVVLTIDLQELSKPEVVASLRQMTFGQVVTLGREMFSQSPRLQHVSQSAPMRLASLITAKKPEINAALFSAPVAGCPVEMVNFRFATLGVELITDFKGYQDRHALSKLIADRHVWGKLNAAVA